MKPEKRGWACLSRQQPWTVFTRGAFDAGHPEIAEIETAYHTLTPLLGIGAARVFLLSLIASGISTVGTMAGQLIMQGFVGFRIPIWVRRLLTMVPASLLAWMRTQQIRSSSVRSSSVSPCHFR
jgi:NRAMP (natural resistance-associated macrophage protein)-like metal ion transporter